MGKKADSKTDFQGYILSPDCVVLGSLLDLPVPQFAHKMKVTIIVICENMILPVYSELSCLGMTPGRSPTNAW